jgi:hypothetical protein
VQIARALALRGHEACEALAQWLASWLAQPVTAVADAAADAVQPLLADAPVSGRAGLLSAAMHCTVRLLFKQRLTAALVPAVQTAHASGHNTGALDPVSLSVRGAHAMIQRHARRRWHTCCSWPRALHCALLCHRSFLCWPPPLARPHVRAMQVVLAMCLLRCRPPLPLQMQT